MKNLAIYQKFSYEQVRNNKSRIQLKCKDKECGWRVYCTVMSDKHTFKLRNFVETHTCEADEKNRNAQAKAPWVADKLEGFLRSHPQMRPKDLMLEVLNQFGASLDGFVQGCRPVVGLDGCFLKAKAYKVPEHDLFMDQLEEDDLKVKEWLDREPKSCRARAHFDVTSKCDAITNNFSESFNNWILKIRDKLLIQFVDKYSLAVMSLLHQRREISCEMPDNELIPTADDVIARLEHTRYKVSGVSLTAYCAINIKSEKKFVVDLSKQECQCIVWQMTGLPCVHPIVVIRPLRPRKESWARYCSPYYHVNAFRATYAGFIFPFDNEEDWGK
ncbi:hypothetical protein IFM89_029311, partial [Coptis chinensis]